MSRDLNFYGQKKKTKFDFEDLSDVEWEKFKKEFYEKPTKEDVQKAMYKLYKGNNNISEITRYYFRELMYDCKLNVSKYSVNEIMNNKVLSSYAYFLINKNKKLFFFVDVSTRSAMERFFGLAKSNFGAIVSQFSLKIVNDILSKYNVNNNWYDFSCGWGSRLTGALINDVNYYGTDPNYLLVNKLNEYIEDWKECINNVNNDKKIYCQGSEYFIPELTNKIGLAFSSPPYYNLENYIYGEQSTKKGSYDMWLSEYLEPTLNNIYKYLIENGILIVNIKSYSKYDLENDLISATKKCGFVLRKTETFQQIQGKMRPTGTLNEKKSTDEPMYVFTKNENVKLEKNKKISLW